MPIIAYQSFNANSSSEHGDKALSFQRFTKSTNKFSMEQGHEILELPVIPEDTMAVVEGPAYKHEIEKLDKGDHTVQVFGAHITQVYQQFWRELGGMPNIMVIGELDASHPDFKKIVMGTNLDITPFPQKKACQSFTAISQGGPGSMISPLGSGIGFVAYSVMGWNVVFVHVPNEFATNADKVEMFYYKIAKGFNGVGKTIHLVLGDTNQKSANFTANVLNSAFGTTAYQTAASKATMIDTFPSLTMGTNSTGKEMYDVAVYRSDLIDLKQVVYISQSPTGITVTDHCGLGVKIEARTSTG